MFLCHIEFVYVLAVDVALATKRRQLNRTVVISNRKGLSVNEQITGPDRQVVPPGTNAIPHQLPFYENEYRYRSILVRREACEDDPALLGTKATTSEREGSRRQPQVTVLRITIPHCFALASSASVTCFQDILR